MHFPRPFLILVVLLFVGGAASAQKKMVKGVVFERATPFRVGEVTVRNLKTDARVRSNYMGEFAIEGSAGDSLSFSKENYADYKLELKNSRDLVIQLIKMRTLQEVTITAPSKKEELDEVMAGYRKKGSYYHGKPPVLAYLFKPLTALYERFGKTPQQAKRFYKYYETELEQTEIDRRFNTPYVKNITALSGKDLTNFMDLYRPTYPKLSGWNDYDLMNYINSCLKDFNAKGRPQAEVLPDLRKLTPPSN